MKYSIMVSWSKFQVINNRIQIAYSLIQVTDLDSIQNNISVAKSFVFELNSKCNLSQSYCVFILKRGVLLDNIEIFWKGDEHVPFLWWIFNTFYHVYQVWWLEILFTTAMNSLLAFSALNWIFQNTLKFKLLFP